MYPRLFRVWSCPRLCRGWPLSHSVRSFWGFERTLLPDKSLCEWAPHDGVLPIGLVGLWTLGLVLHLIRYEELLSMKANRSQVVEFVRLGICLTVLVVAVYVATYFVLVRRAPLITTGVPPWTRRTSYRIGGDYSRWLYAPIHELDRHFRMDYWETNEAEFEQTRRRMHTR